MVAFRHHSQMLQAMILRFLGLCAKITDLAVGGIIRSAFDSACSELEETTTTLMEVHNARFIDNAIGDELDRQAAEHGCSRFPDSYAQGPARFFGAALSSVPKGTKVRSVTGIVYGTTVTMTIAAGLEWVDVPLKCNMTGPRGNATIGGVRYFVGTAPSGITDVRNMLPLVNGGDAEPDAIFRRRVKTWPDFLSIGTREAYERWCNEATRKVCQFYDGKAPASCEQSNANFGTNCKDGTYTDCNEWAFEFHVLRARPDVEYGGVEDIAVRILPGAGELPTWLGEVIEAYCDDHAGLTIDHAATEIEWAEIDIRITVMKRVGFTDNEVKTNVEQAVLAFINANFWEWGRDVLIQDIWLQAARAEGVYVATVLSPLGNVTVGENSLPRVRTLVIGVEGSQTQD